MVFNAHEDQTGPISSNTAGNVIKSGFLKTGKLLAQSWDTSNNVTMITEENHFVITIQFPSNKDFSEKLTQNGYQPTFLSSHIKHQAVHSIYETQDFFVQKREQIYCLWYIHRQNQRLNFGFQTVVMEKALNLASSAMGPLKF